MRQNPHPANDYINATFVYEPPHLQQVRLKGEEVLAGMQISPSEGKLLYVLAKMIAAKNILEIGTFVGYSTLWLAQSLPDNGRITTIEARHSQAEIARVHFVNTNKITLLEGRALDILPTLHDCYDMVFIDAAKNEYMEYVRICEPKLRAGGLMLLDNSLLFGNVYGEGVKRASAEAIASVQAANAHIATHYDSILIPTEEGLTVGIKR